MKIAVTHINGNVNFYDCQNHKNISFEKSLVVRKEKEIHMP
jgi:hypothetical protein